MSTRLALLVILDGLRRDTLSPERTPHLWRLAGRGTSFGGYRSMFPSATRVVSSSTATGCFPAQHGLAGNSMALLDAEGRLHPHDAGLPEFLPARRAMHGQALDRPTMADRLAGQGRVYIGSNVSPGAALAHDPNRAGWLVNRAVSHAPGRTIPNPEGVTLSIEGDRLITERFIAEAVAADGLRPALGVLWLGEPDASQHAHTPGAPETWAAIAAADARLGEVMAAADRRRAAGDTVLLLAGSDHGHETVEGVIDVDAEMTAAGLLPGAEHGLVALSNGSSVLVHLAPNRDPAPVLEWLRARDWAAAVLESDALRALGQRPGADGLLCIVSMRRHDGANAHGLPGMTLVAKPASGKADRLGRGQHGGLGAVEQAPVMIIEGPGFGAGMLDMAPAQPVDLAPTILGFLGTAIEGPAMDGTPLQARPAVERAA
jgi:arylsulfatase A-like enzyme